MLQDTAHKDCCTLCGCEHADPNCLPNKVCRRCEWEDYEEFFLIELGGEG